MIVGDIVVTMTKEGLENFLSDLKTSSCIIIIIAFLICIIMEIFFHREKR